MHLSVEDLAGNAVFGAPPLYQRLVSIGGFAAQVVIDMGDEHFCANPMQGFHQDHGVQAAADASKEGGVGFNAVTAEPLPHVLHQSVAVIRHRNSRFASSRQPSAGIQRIHWRDRSEK